VEGLDSRKRLYRSDEVARLFSLSVSAVWKLVSQGEFEVERVRVGRGRRITAESIRRYIERRRAFTSELRLAKCSTPGTGASTAQTSWPGFEKKSGLSSLTEAGHRQLHADPEPETKH